MKIGEVLQMVIMKILVLLEPNGGVHKSVKLNSSGNFYYELGGDNAWLKTRKF